MQFALIYLLPGFLLCIPVFYGYLHRYKRIDLRRDGMGLFITAITWPLWVALWGREKIRERSK